MDYWYHLLKVCFHFVSSCLKRDPCGHYTNRGDCSQTNTNLKGGGAGTARKNVAHSLEANRQMGFESIGKSLVDLNCENKILAIKSLAHLTRSFDVWHASQHWKRSKKRRSPVAFSTGSRDISHHMTFIQELVQRFNYNKNRVLKYNWHARLVLE